MKICLKKAAAILALFTMICPLASASAEKKDGLKKKLLQEKKKRPKKKRRGMGITINGVNEFFDLKDEIIDDLNEQKEDIRKMKDELKEDSKEVMNHGSDKGKEVIDYFFSRAHSFVWKNALPASLLFVTVCVIGYVIARQLDGSEAK